MAITTGQAIFSLGLIVVPLLIAAILIYMSFLLRDQEYYESKGLLDYVFQTHMMLRLFFLFMAIIFITSSLYLAIGFENEYLLSVTGQAFHTIAGYSVYVLLFVFIVYWLIWIIYNSLQWRRGIEHGEIQNEREY